MAILESEVFKEAYVDLKTNYLFQMSVVDDEQAVELKRKVHALDELISNMESLYK